MSLLGPFLPALIGMAGDLFGASAERKAIHAETDWYKQFYGPDLLAKQLLFPRLAADIARRMGRGSERIHTAYEMGRTEIARNAEREARAARSRFEHLGDVGQSYGAQWRAKRAGTEAQGRLSMEEALAEEQYQSGIRNEALGLIQPSYGGASKIGGLLGAAGGIQADLWRDAGIFAADMLGRFSAQKDYGAGERSSAKPTEDVGGGGEPPHAPTFSTPEPTAEETALEPSYRSLDYGPYSDESMGASGYAVRGNRVRKRRLPYSNYYSRPRLTSDTGGLW